MGVIEILESLNISESCYKDILNLVEEYINELKDGTYRRMKDIANAIVDEQEKQLSSIEKEENKEYIRKEIAKRRRQAAKAESKYEKQVVDRAKKEYEDSKKKEN